MIDVNFPKFVDLPPADTVSSRSIDIIDDMIEEDCRNFPRATEHYEEKKRLSVDVPFVL